MGKMRKIVFWQNIISPHQVDFLRKLSKFHDITLVVDEAQDTFRKNDGWVVPNFSNIKLVIRPSDDIFKGLFKNNENIHIFSGIGAYKYVHKGFKKAISINAKIGLFSEPVKMTGFRGFLKYLKGNFQRLRYNNKIDFITATGVLGVNTYLDFGYKKNKIFQSGYFIDPIESFNNKKDRSIVYVGQLIERKQIVEFAKLFILNNGLGYQSLNIIGKGPQKMILEEISKSSNKVCKINLLGRLNSKETYEIISKSSLLVIPSTFDGWAVVVNEALLCGTPVIASSSVGAGVLLGNNIRGDVFEMGDYKKLKEIVEKRSQKNINLQESSLIKDWALRNISPEIAVNYFNDILNYVYSSSKEKPNAPWL